MARLSEEDHEMVHLNTDPLVAEIRENGKESDQCK